MIDYHGEEVKGHFYGGEIIPVRFDPMTLFKIERVIKTRVVDSVEQFYIKHQSWPKSYNEWILTIFLCGL